jgi:hypothetical protein
MPDYLVKVKPNKEDSETERLIRAKNQAAAVAHVVKDTVVCSKATNDDLMRLAKAGVDVEVAE